MIQEHLFSNAILLYNLFCKDTPLFMVLQYIKKVRITVLTQYQSALVIIFMHTQLLLISKK